MILLQVETLPAFMAEYNLSLSDSSLHSVCSWSKQQTAIFGLSYSLFFKLNFPKHYNPSHSIPKFTLWTFTNSTVPFQSIVTRIIENIQNTVVMHIVWNMYYVVQTCMTEIKHLIIIKNIFCYFLWINKSSVCYEFVSSVTILPAVYIL